MIVLNLKHNINYFKKNENVKFLGGGILIVSLFLLWIAGAVHMPIFFMISPPAIVAGFVMFLIGSSGRASEDDLDSYIKRGTEGLETDFSDDIHYNKKVQKHIPPVYIEGYEYDDSVMIKKAKNGSLRTSKYSKALVYIMTDRLYINKKTVSLISEDVEKSTTEILYDDIKSVELVKEEKNIIFAKKTFKTKPFLFVVEYGENKFTSPIFDNMDSVHLVEKINKSISEYKKSKA